MSVKARDTSVDIDTKSKTNGKAHHHGDDELADRFTPKVVMALILWYFWSGCTLFMNKYVIDIRKGDSAILSKAAYIFVRSDVTTFFIFQVAFK